MESTFMIYPGTFFGGHGNVNLRRWNANYMSHEEVKERRSGRSPLNLTTGAISGP